MTKIAGNVRPLNRFGLESEVYDALARMREALEKNPEAETIRLPIIVGWELEAKRFRGSLIYIWRLDSNVKPYEPIEIQWLRLITSRIVDVKDSWNGAGLNTFSVLVGE